MRRFYRPCFFLVFSFALVISVRAQEAIKIGNMVKSKHEITIKDMSRINREITVPDTLDGWNFRWFGGLNGSQAAYSNWSQGGVNSISGTVSTVFDMFYRKDRLAYAFSTNLKYGKAKIKDEGARKTDDRIAINNKFSYLFNNHNWSAFANINLTTQFDQGYNYNVSDNAEPELLSEFFAPAYLTEIVGVSYQPADYFSAEAGLATKETIVKNDSLSTRYGLAAGDNFRFEPGYALSLNFHKKIVSNVQLISSMETFTNLQRHIKSTDVHFSNELIGKINNFMNMSLQFVMVYNNDYSKQLQIKQVLSAGLSFDFI